MLKHPVKYSAINLNELIRENWELTLMAWRDRGNGLIITEKFRLSPKMECIVGIENDLSIVLVNLFNTTLDSMNEKATSTEYEPEIEVNTKEYDEYCEIIIKDNGVGLSEDMRSQIFMPFIATDNEGRGISPGLTLTYEIVTHHHDGKIDVRSRDGGGTEFRIELPKTREIY